MKKLYNISEAAAFLKVSTETLRRWDKEGKFKSIRNPMNNYRLYPEEQLMTLAEEMQLELTYPRKKLTDHNPYFSTSYGRLYNMDAVKFLKSLDDDSVYLIFADPPYNIKKAQWDTFPSQKEYVDWSMAWIREANRVLKNTGSLYICGFSEILADIKWAAAPIFKGCKWLVWYYRNKANLGNDWGRSHESILHFRKSKHFQFNIDPIRIPYNQHTLKYPRRTQATSSQYNHNNKKYEWEPNPLGAKPKDVLEIPTLSNGSWEKYPHTTQKPVELLRKIIVSSSQEEELVVDPFGGSGTTYAVAEAYKRKWLGAELEKAFCDIMVKRLSDKEHIRRIATSKDENEAVKRRKDLRG